MALQINKKKVLMIFIALLLAALLLFSAYTWTTLKFSYASGERVGTIQKFSNKGWVCKTWEGELSMVPVMGALPEKFYFSVRDDIIAQKLNQSLGKRISLYYDQHIGVPSKCFGESEYFVTDVKVLE